MVLFIRDRLPHRSLSRGIGKLFHEEGPGAVTGEGWEGPAGSRTMTGRMTDEERSSLAPKVPPVPKDFHLSLFFFVSADTQIHR